MTEHACMHQDTTKIPPSYLDMSLACVWWKHMPHIWNKHCVKRISRWKCAVVARAERVVEKIRKMLYKLSLYHFCCSFCPPLASIACSVFFRHQNKVLHSIQSKYSTEINWSSLMTCVFFLWFIYPFQIQYTEAITHSALALVEKNKVPQVLVLKNS